MSGESAKKTGAAVDFFTLDIVRDSLLAIGEEMFVTLGRTAMGPIIYEVLDYASGLTDAKGNLLTQGNGVTGFLGILSFMVKEVIKKFGDTGKLYPGDIMVMNDPHAGGGTHLSDVGFVMPIFHDGELVAFSVNKAHWTEVGGKDPGSWTVDATEIFQEGLQFPCVKLFDRGVLNEPVVDMIRANVRCPDASLGDMWAQVASLKTGDKRFGELCNRYGTELIMASIERLLDQGETVALKELARLPKGTFEAEDWIDDDGIGNGPFKVVVKVTVTDDKFTCDFRGSHPQVPGPINASYSGLVSAVRIIFLAATNPSQDVNDGVFRPLEVIVDKGSIFSSERPAATSTYWETMLYAADLVWKALAPLLPDRLTAGHLLSVCGYVLSGRRPDTGENIILTGPSTGGWGAGRGKDGENAQFCLADGETFNLPIEVTEARYGVRMSEYSLRADGGGAGEYRGGRGAIRGYQVLGDQHYFTGTFGRHKYLPWGLDGGMDGSRNEFHVIRKDGSTAGVFGKYARFPLHEGDTVRLITASGGGYGNPFDRPAEKVARDAKNEYITIEQARDSYGVILEPGTFGVAGYTEERKKHSEKS